MKTNVDYSLNIEKMSIEQKVAQMIMVDFNGHSLNKKVRQNLENIPWSGVILFTKNIKNRKQLGELNREIMELPYDIPPFISLDQEGGLVNRVEFPDMHLSPGSFALGKIGDPELAEEVAFVSGVELRELGFHLNFAPVMDVNVNPANPVIGVRSFGEEPALVSRMGSAQIRGYERSGIASCAKHFPGHGDTSFDSHLCLASVEADLERIEVVELPPFKAAIEAGVPTIMTAHVIFPAINGEKRIPATLSKEVLTDLLRCKMGFEGLIITDSMAMKAIADNYGTGEAAVMAINAGADIVMMCGASESQLEAYKSILLAVSSGRIPVRAIDEAVSRILKFKEKYVVNPSPIPLVSPDKRKKVIQEASSRSVCILYDYREIFPINPKDKRTLVLSPDLLYPTMFDKSGERGSIFSYIKNRFQSIKRMTYDSLKPDVGWFKKVVSSNYDLIIFEIYSRGKIADNIQSATLAAISSARKKNIPIIILSLSSCYGIPEEADAAITAYNYLPSSLEEIAKKIMINPSGYSKH